VVQAVEAARTVEDHVITDMREADVGSIRLRHRKKGRIINPALSHWST
jgi:hypothetical protein